MTRTKTVIIQGHPDSVDTHLCHAIERSYVKGAASEQNEFETIDVGRLDFNFLRTRCEFESQEPPADIMRAQQSLATADFVVFIYPLWFCSMPARLKSFIEQTFRPEFMYGQDELARRQHKLVRRYNARMIVTMGQPYSKESAKKEPLALDMAVLFHCGFDVTDALVIGSASVLDEIKVANACEKARHFGAQAQK